MSESNLRDVLGKLARECEVEAELGGTVSYRSLAADLKRLLADHPAEPVGVEDDVPLCAHCGDRIHDSDDGWRSMGDFGGTGSMAYTEPFWCAESTDHKHAYAEPVGVSDDLRTSPADGPADHILDKFLVSHDVRDVSWEEFRRVLSVLRWAFQAETRAESEVVGVSDEAVEAAAKAVSLDWQNYVASMRKALEAAAPLMGATPQPTLDRKAVRKVLDTHRVGWQLPGSPAYVDGYRDALTDDLAALVRPLPTREQIADLLTYFRAQREGCEQLRAANEESGADLTAIDYHARAETWRSAAEAVELALLDGTESSPATNLDRAEEPK